jgi:hypothetical protein
VVYPLDVFPVMVRGVETVGLEYAGGGISPRTWNIGGSGCAIDCAEKSLLTFIVTES